MAKELIIAKTLREAASCVRSGAAVLAGGTEVNRLNSSVNADVLVSIGRIENLDSIEECIVDGVKKIKIGATATFQEVIDSELVPVWFREACLYMSSRQKRDMATIGGNIAALRDDSYIWATLLACNAGIEIYKGGKPVALSCRDYVSNEKAQKYIVLAVYLPAKDLRVVSKRYANTAASHAFLTMACCKEGRSTVYGICAKNCGIYCCKSTEDMSFKYKTDMFGSAEYKNYILKITAEDLKKALAEGGAK